MSEYDSDIDMMSDLPEVEIKIPPKHPKKDVKTKKITTKMMIEDALFKLETNPRKGVSLYAIKKHLSEKYEVNTDKLNYLIKKTIKAGVENGTFVQIKGIGAVGSFKLANKKNKPKTMKKSTKPTEKREKKEKSSTSQKEKPKKLKKTGRKANEK